MQQPIASPYPISDFVLWKENGQLEIAPKFQRRDVWSGKAKSYLIDSILRSMPIPPLFIRLKVDPNTKKTIREVVDGQQRLRAVFGFLSDDFQLMKVHNAEYADQNYSALPEEAKRSILAYKFHVYTLEDVGDADVLAVFARMNTYTAKLSAQELRNAEFFGAFKQIVYKLALQHYAFWRNNNILTDRKIARMGDAELVSELVVSMLDGLRQTKAHDLHDFYEKYDDAFADSSRVSKEFEMVINAIGDIYGGKLRSSPFRRKPIFYSLFLVIYDSMFGLPKSRKHRVALSSKRMRGMSERLDMLGTIIAARRTPTKYLDFVEATKRGTADPAKRRLRHSVIWEHILGGNE